MMKVSILTIVLAVIFMPGWTQTSPRQAIETKAKSIQTLRCSFVQTRQSTLMNEVLTSSGSIFFSAPDKMRWQQTSPADYVMVFNGTKIHIKDGGSTASEFDSSSSRMLRELSNIIVGGISGRLFSDTKNYEISYVENKSGFMATLKPRNAQMRRFMSAIRIQFDSEWLATTIEIKEGNGDMTLITLSSREVNKTLDVSLFYIK